MYLRTMNISKQYETNNILICKCARSETNVKRLLRQTG